MATSILNNTIIATGGRIANIGLGLVITAAITRLLGANFFGIYTLALSYGILFQLLADMGLYLSLTRDLAEHPNEQTNIVSKYIHIRTLLLLTSFSLALITAIFIPQLKPIIPIIAIGSVGLFAQSISQLFMGIFQTHASVWRATAGDLIGRIAQITAIFLLANLSLSVTAITIAFTIGAIVSLVIHLKLSPVAIFLPLIKGEPSIVRWREGVSILRDSWPLGAMLILNAIYFRSDILIISFFRSEAEVGLYGIAYRLIESALFFPAMFGGLILPRLTKSPNQRSTLTSESLQFLLLAATLILIALLSFSTPIIHFIAGQEFKAAGLLLKILSIALATMFLGNLFGFSLVAQKQQKSLLKLYTFLASFNIALNLIFIPHFGAEAAAWTTVATELIAMIIAGYLVYKLTPFKLSLHFAAKLLAVTAITVSITQLIPNTWHIIISLGITTTVFAIATYGLNIYSPLLLKERG